ncbi:MAG: hypothetical protein OEN56_15620, partial [Gemmatimonadota bacterium]|nr:hypothetical protein [Gemmatimonadota bacterium]
PDYQLLPGLRAQTLFLAGAADEARKELQQVADGQLTPTARRVHAWTFLAQIAFWEGRLGEGRDALLAAERLVDGADDAAAWAQVVETVHTAALVGEVAWARSHLEPKLDAGLPGNVVLDRRLQADLIESLALISGAESGDVMMDPSGSAPDLASAYRRTQVGDTVGLRAIIEELPLSLVRRVLLSDRLGDLDRTIELSEEVVRPGYTGWGNTPHRLRALMHLGPLYEEAGDTVRAIEAYRSFSRLWASGDEGGRAVAGRFAARADELETGIRVGAR